jgi:hypothetical protein
MAEEIGMTTTKRFNPTYDAAQARAEEGLAPIYVQVSMLGK